MMALGVICMAIVFFTDDANHTRFWSNYLINSVFFLGISFVATFVLAAFCIGYSGWHVVFKRIWEGFSLFLIVGLFLMLVVIAGIWGHFHHLYHWADKAAVAADEVLKGKSSFLNPVWYTLGTLIIVGTWYYFARKFRAFSLEEDDHGDANYKQHKRFKKWASIFLPIGGFTSAAMIWQWIMSVDAHWYSTMFAWYTTASWFVSMLALTMLLLLYLKSKGYFTFVTTEHIHDLGKFIFAFSIFWTYLWFSQFMLIWYGNNGEETVYFKERFDSYPVLFWANLGLNFFLPFLILLRNDTKRKIGTLVLVSTIVLLGHWLDFFQMVKPGTLITAKEAAEHGQHHEVGAASHEETAPMPAAAHGDSAVASHETTEAAGEHTPAAEATAHSEAAKGEAHAAEAGAHHEEANTGFYKGFTLPGLLDLGTFIGFLGLFLYFALMQLAKAPLLPKKDPYIGESLNHHVQ